MERTGGEGGVCNGIPNKVVLEKLPEKVASEQPGNRGNESPENAGEEHLSCKTAPAKDLRVRTPTLRRLEWPGTEWETASQGCSSRSQRVKLGISRTSAFYSRLNGETLQFCDTAD